ncbi:hypothetical protein EZV62_006200 [Acer yangbiense]|uniref:F-box associated beta-propeller type 1 domain-containing protein n=1 Tax=Acer yangbiense TaxID=1000413 RepID=A0A5C7IPU0_9ROSI|nr:hypothetical protein EZV62_006200 [Acer yangbiense]
MHLTKTERENLFIESRTYDVGICCFYSIDLESITYDVDKVVAVKLDFDIEGGRYPRISSYSNGLLCIVLENCFWLYNPSTRERKQVKFQGGMKCCFEFGFSYVDSIDDYKFVRLHHLEKIVEIYSLRKNSWKSIKIEHDLILYNIRYCTCELVGFPLNGAIHWEFYYYDKIENPSVIVAFDLFEENFKILTLPNIIVGSEFVGIFGGYLCTISRSRRGDITGIWVMKEYSVKASWTKILTVNNIPYPRPLCYLKNSNITMFSTSKGLAFYNPEYQKFKKIEVDGIQKFWVVYPYVESLASPNYENHFTTEVEPEVTINEEHNLPLHDHSQTKWS